MSQDQLLQNQFGCFILVKEDSVFFLQYTDKENPIDIFQATKAGMIPVDQTITLLLHDVEPIIIRLNEIMKAEDRSQDFYKNEGGEDWFDSTLSQMKKAYMPTILASIFINLLVFVVPLFVMNVYDRVIPNQATHTLWSFAIGAIIFVLFDLFLRVARGTILEQSGGLVNFNLEDQLFEQVFKIRSGHKSLSSGGYVKLTKAMFSVRQFYTSSVIAGIVDFPFIILYAAIIYLIAGSLVLIPIAGVLLFCY